MAVSIDKAAPQERPVTAYSWVVLFLLAITYTLNFLDRQLVGTLGVQIQDALGIDASQLGKVSGVYFALFYCTISVPVALLADRTHRVRIVAGGAILFSVATIACGQARTYAHLVMARMAVGLGEAGGAPPSYSLVSDYFPPQRRSEALALFSLGVPFGSALGIYAGAKLTAAWDWRMPFLVVGLVGVVCAVLVLLFVKEPKRGAQDNAATLSATQGERVSLMETIKAFFTNPVLVMAGLASGVAALVALGLNLGAPQVLQREKGMGLDDYAVYYSLVIGVGMGLGSWASGWLADRFGSRRASGYALVPAAALAIAVPFYLGFIWAPTWQMALLFLIVPSFLNIFYLAPAIAVVVNTVSPARRTMASALLLLLLNGLGFGFGPTLVGDWAKHFGETNPGEGWSMALYALAPFYAIAIVLHLVLARQLHNREKRLAASVAA